MVITARGPARPPEFEANLSILPMSMTKGVFFRSFLYIPGNIYYDFKHRAALNLYGTFPKMGLIPRSQLSEMFAQLTRTPFGSFYSGSSWNEHLADYVTYHHIEKKLNGAVTVELLRIGNVVDRYEPVKTPLAQQREKTIRAFYD